MILSLSNLIGDSVTADVSNASPEDISATVASKLHYITSKEGLLIRRCPFSLYMLLFLSYYVRRVFHKRAEYLGGG